MLSPVTRDRRALALTGESKSALLRTPADSPVPSASDVVLDGTVNTIGVLDAKATITLRGDGELTARSLVRAMPRTALKDFMTAVASSIGIDGDVSEPSTSDPADTRDPFRIMFRVRSKGALDWAAARSEFAVTLHDRIPYATDNDRKDLHRLHFASTYGSRLRATIDLPPGYDASAPQPLRVSRAGLSYSSSYAAAATHLTVERELKIAVRDVPETAFGEYAAFVSAVNADAKQHFSVRGTVTGTPAIPADATSDELYKAGQAAWEADRYDAAVALYKKSTELAPKMGDAWVALGLAYDQLGKHDEAAAAIQKQIDLDPYNKRAYGDLGFVLQNGEKDDEAIKAYVRQTELNPLDGDTFKRLGLLYVETHRPVEAIPILEKALGLLSRDAWVAANLVQASLETKQPEKARQALDRLMERKPNADVRSYVSWNMAQHAFELARADELARSAEKDLLAGLANVDLASVNEASFDRVDRLGWAWDAIGWIAFQQGDLRVADAYVRAAWQMLGDPDVAVHLARVCEKRDKLADAMNYYLTAQALDSKPSADLVARVKKLAGGGDLPKMLESARKMAPLERSFAVPGSTAGEAQFVAIVDNTRKAIDVRFVSGDDALKPLAPQVLRSVLLPVLFPTDAPARLPVGLRVRCRGSTCGGLVESPARVRLTAPQR
jgi:tetratricopeptide (TPR) repeat protein